MPSASPARQEFRVSAPSVLILPLQNSDRLGFRSELTEILFVSRHSGIGRPFRENTGATVWKHLCEGDAAALGSGSTQQNEEGRLV